MIVSHEHVYEFRYSSGELGVLVGLDHRGLYLSPRKTPLPEGWNISLIHGWLSPEASIFRFPVVAPLWRGQNLRHF
jgi:hypothetical protein